MIAVSYSKKDFVSKMQKENITDCFSSWSDVASYLAKNNLTDVCVLATEVFEHMPRKEALKLLSKILNNHKCSDRCKTILIDKYYAS